MTITEITLTIIASYCISVGIYSVITALGIKISISIKPPRAEKERPKIESRAADPPPIMGTSNYKMRHDAPTHAKANREVSNEENATTFVPESSAEEAVQSKIEADFPDDLDDAESVVDDDTSQEELASGVAINEVQQAIDSIKDPTSTPAEMMASGETLSKLIGSEIIDQLSGGDAQMNKKIRETMHHYFESSDKECKRISSAK
ncbi:MAG: hypothetical protein SNI87_06490 [Rikenellaceae bacterium]